ncbi:MAG: AGE family epimerase/isomerase [bacterium]
MRSPSLLIILVVLITMTLISCVPESDSISVLEGSFWKEQGLQQVLPIWTQKAWDSGYGGFHTFLDRSWEPYNGAEKYPGMISRHLFSYSVAYLLSGNKVYLKQAEKIKDYLIFKGWDAEYGGWFDALDRYGNMIKSSKDAFYQMYAQTGLTLYYFVTRDPEVYKIIQEGHKILSNQGWDDRYGGYYRCLDRDLSVAVADKDFSPQLAPLSGYLIYLYLATRDSDYLEKMEETLDLVWRKMRDPESGWIRERFSQDWTYQKHIRSDSTEFNIGHNAEVVWMLLRVHALTGKSKYREQAMQLQKFLVTWGMDSVSGAWVHGIGTGLPPKQSNATPWWIQAYGNMVSLNLYRTTQDSFYVDLFKKGAHFWNQSVLDSVYGGAFLSVYADERIHKGDKAVRTKTSYHTLEHSLLNYVYLKLWYEKKPAVLYFYVENPDKVEKLYPLPIADPEVSILWVEINGDAWSDFNPEQGWIQLPEEGPARIKVELIVSEK